MLMELMGNVSKYFRKIMSLSSVILISQNTLDFSYEPYQITIKYCCDL